MKKISIENKINNININKIYVLIGSICILVVIALLVISINQNTKQYLVQLGILEHTELATGYIVKNEVTIEKQQTKILVPVVSEGARIAKDGIIATYKGIEYKDYEETLNQMDKEILERMKDLPAVYSSEVEAIEGTIYTLVKKSIGETSYNKMQEYKQKINSNINKRANIIGSLSPDGAEIRTLIEKRNQYENDAKKSNDNVLSPIPGIVSYTVDGLEDKLNFEDIDGLDYNNIKEIINNSKPVDNTKIKVVNNYEAYIVMKVSLENEAYIGEGYNYRLRLIEQENYELVAKLEKTVKTEDGIEVYFKVANGIENLVDFREVELEIVWDYAEGLIVHRKALNKYDNIAGYYITAIKGGQYENIPVTITLENQNYVVVKNYDYEQLQELGLESTYSLKLYDRVLVETKK